MNFESYQKAARATAVYPENMKVVYPALGLAGECGEVCEKIKKVYRDKNGLFDEETKEAIQKELGDVMWYMAALAGDLGIDLHVMAQMNIAKLQKRALKNQIHGEGDTREETN